MDDAFNPSLWAPANHSAVGHLQAWPLGIEEKTLHSGTTKLWGGPRWVECLGTMAGNGTKPFQKDCFLLQGLLWMTLFFDIPLHFEMYSAVDR